MPSEYRFRRRVQFHETDAAGLVHFSWFFRYMEEAEHALWREAGLSIHAPDGLVGFPRVSASFDYHRALRFEQEFDVWIRITAITKKSIHYTCVLSDGDTRIATGSAVVVCVGRQAHEPMRSVAIPQDILSRLQVAPDPDRATASAATDGP